MKLCERFLIASGAVFYKSLHYILAILSIRRSRRGRVRPNLFTSTFCASSGLVTQRSRTVLAVQRSLVRERGTVTLSGGTLASTAVIWKQMLPFRPVTGVRA